jgi:hypothetical protein
MMGSYTYGGISVQFSRELTASEFLRLETLAPKALVLQDWDTKGDSPRPLEEEWDFEGGYGDIGTATLHEQGLELSTEGKVYCIENGVRAVVDLLPPGVTASGWGEFETEGERWALKVEGRTVTTPSVELQEVEPVKQLVEAAKTVVDAWEDGDLAAAVNALRIAVAEHES